jgi:type 1 fimbriae regulatory protein FimB
VDKLIEATKRGRNEARDRCLLLLIFRHGLRVSEACGLKLDQVDTESRVLHVRRLKRGLSTTQPLRKDELRAIGAWLKQRARMKPIGKAFFVSEQRRSLHRSTVNLLLQKYSAAASLSLRAHPHMLRHACGFALADQGPTPGSFRTTSDTARWSIPSNTPPPTRRRSRDSGGEANAHPACATIKRVVEA